MCAQPGDRVGDYRLIEQIGAGGMGQVYLAENVQMHKCYALKILPHELADQPGFVDRFRDEARVMADLRHPNIVQVHAMSHHRGSYYLVMDYVSGPDFVGGRPLSLHDHLATQPDSRLPEADVRKIAIDIASALAYAHDRGVVHRDIKPANILIDAERNARLTDFGLAKAIGDEFIKTQIHSTMRTLSTGKTHRSPDTPLPRPSDTVSDEQTRHARGESGRGSTAESILGTYDYMAPEQRGELPGAEINQTTDLYSFGVLLYRLLTGERPAGMADPPSRAVRGLSPAWDPIVARCLKKRQSARYQSAAALLDDLRRSRMRRRPQPKQLAGYIAAALLLSIGVVAVIIGQRDEARPRMPGLVANQTIASAPNAPSAAPQQEAVAPPQNATPSPTAAPAPPPTTPLVTVADVTRTRDKAMAAFELVVDLDPAQGFGELIAQAEALRSAAHADAAAMEYKSALSRYEQLLHRSTEILQRQQARQSAAAVKEDMQHSAAKLPHTDAQIMSLLSLDEVQRQQEQGQAAFERGEFDVASSHWSAAKDAYAKAVESAAQLTAERDTAQTARMQAESARDDAQAAGAPDHAKQAWEEAQTMAARAEAEAQAGRFADALQTWQAATERYQQAVSATLGPRKVAAAMTRYSEALAQYDSRRLRNYGGAAWSQVDAALSEARAGGDDHEMVAEAYDRAAALLPAADRAATAGYIQQLLITAAKNDNRETGRTALAALDEVLRLDPRNADARALRGKIEAYYGVINSIGMRLIYIPPGRFLMGSPVGEEGRDIYEAQHEVTLTRGFYIGATEVTQAQWRQVMDANPSSFEGPQRPVENVSYEDTVRFCERLSQTEGRRYRLPTEAEWEYACRAETTGPFHTGPMISTDLANYDGEYTYGDGAIGEDREKTVDVAGFKPNAWGLFDMHGNVQEWCADWYGKYPGDAVVDPSGPTVGKVRVLRGGSWYSRPFECRSAHRSFGAANLRRNHIGFRVVLEAE